MNMKPLAVAAAFAVCLSGPAFAQTAAGGGAAEGNMNNPGSVKSNSEKGMERMGGSATGADSTGSTMAPGRASDVPSNATPGAPGGSNSGNAATGSGAAPSGK